MSAYSRLVWGGGGGKYFASVSNNQSEQLYVATSKNPNKENRQIRRMIMDNFASYKFIVYIWKYFISVAKIIVEKLTKVDTPLTLRH